MQLILTFHAEETILPIAHRQHLQAMLYRVLESENARFSANIHDGGKPFERRRYKLFTFGPLTGRYTVEGGTIRFHGRTWLEIRSADPAFLQTLLGGLTPGTEVRLGKNLLTVTDCRLEDHKLFDRRLQVHTLSPIVAYITQPDGRTRFYSPQEPEFCSAVVSNARRKWGSLYGPETPFALVVAPTGAMRKQVTLFKTTRINAWFGEFVLEGEPAVLDFLYNTGLGAKSSQGFGMFEPLEKTSK